MIDIEKAIKEVEEKQGIRFTEDQREAAKGFGMFLNSFWGNVIGNSSCDDEVKKDDKQGEGYQNDKLFPEDIWHK